MAGRSHFAGSYRFHRAHAHPAELRARDSIDILHAIPGATLALLNYPSLAIHGESFGSRKALLCVLREPHPAELRDRCETRALIQNLHAIIDYGTGFGGEIIAVWWELVMPAD